MIIADQERSGVALSCSVNFSVGQEAQICLLQEEAQHKSEGPACASKNSRVDKVSQLLLSWLDPHVSFPFAIILSTVSLRRT